MNITHSARSLASAHQFGRASSGAAIASTLACLAASCSSEASLAGPNALGGVDTSGVEFFIETPHSGGRAQALGLASLRYGRFVRVFGLDSLGARVPMSGAFVIEPTLSEVGGQLDVETNAVTGQDVLVIARDVTDLSQGGGRAQFFDILRSTEDNLPTVRVADIGTVGVFSLVPRNAALVLEFDDLVDPRTIDATTVRVTAGYPPTQPVETRILIDVHHGGLADLDGVAGTEFYPTRVIIDPTVDEREAFASDPPLPLNSVGLPFSIDANRANLRLSLPTVPNQAAGQPRVLSNPTQHALAQVGNGPIDFGDSTRPVLRAFRSGGRPDLTSDPSNGFLPDDTGPRVVGESPVTIVDPPQHLGGARFVVPTLRFTSLACAHAPRVGDILTQSDVIAEVVAASPHAAGGVASEVQVHLAAYPATWSSAAEWATYGPGEATLQSAYLPLEDLGREPCFVTVFPRASGYPLAPTTGVDPFATYRVRFSEPMDSTSLTAFDSLTLTRSPLPATGAASTDQYVIGRVGQSLDLREFTFRPDLPLNHAAGADERYYLALATGAFTPRDLAGNALTPFGSVQLAVAPGATPQRNGGRVSRFVSIDEEAPIAGAGDSPLPEWSGQILIDSAQQRIRPRPVVREQIVIDRAQPTLSAHTPFSTGIVTPLSNFGSKLQTLWRPADCNFSLNDPAHLNVDVEGLGWVPAGGALVADSFTELEIRLGHSRFAPDEVIDPGNLWPLYGNSGLIASFRDNLLPDAPQVVVHPRERGYILNPADLFVTAGGTRVMPFPVNRGVPANEQRTFTWRDTSLRGRAGPQNGGVHPSSFLIALGLPVPAPQNKFYPPNEAQTAGLPLLLEFRTHRDGSALGLNGFDVNLAANSSSQPNFRAFSTGGINQNGVPVYITPDTEDLARGGLSPGSNPPGAATPGLDNTVYLGALDLVARVSRAHSVWFRSVIVGEGSFGGRTYLPPTLEPRAEDQPLGASIEVAYRGATTITYIDAVLPSPQDNDGGATNPVDPVTGLPATDFQINAFTIDLYGDYYNEVDPLNNVHRAANANPGLAFLGGDSAWKSDVSALADAVFYQVRVTFAANIATGETPVLSAFALSWTQ